MDDLVSIIMPSYNTAPYIEESIRSVLQQSYENWELIIVDDCSTDKTYEIVQQFLSDKRIHYSKNGINSGAAVSRNKALREARGKWIAFLDSDDIWLPEKLKKQIAFMKENNYHFSYTQYEEIDENSIPLGVRISGPRQINKAGMYAYCWPGCLTVMYDAETVGLVQIEDIKKNNDYAIWLKVCKQHDCMLLKEITGKYRKRTGSISRQSVKTMIGWHYKLWRRVEKKFPVVALYYTLLNLFFGFIKKKIYVVKLR